VSERILAIGTDAEHERIDHADFDGEVALTGRAAAVVDPAAVPSLWSHLEPGRDSRLATDADSDGGFGSDLVALFRRRRREATELLAAGGSLLCFLRPLGRPLHVRRPTRRGRAATILHAYSWLPDHPALAQLVIAAAGGRGAKPVDAGHPLWQLLRAQGDQVVHEACVANEQLQPQWHVVATDALGRPIALEVAMGEGKLLFAPPLAAAGAAAERGSLLVECLASEEPAAEPEPVAPEPTPPPAWLADCLLPGQAELEAELADITEQLERLEAEQANVRARDAELAELGRLLYARSAAELAGPAARALRALRFDVAEAGDACLELRCPEGQALVALAASADAIESDPYWTLVRRLEGQEEPPSGLVVGNAFCDAPPAERAAPFADLLRRGAEHRGFGLLATVELHAAMAALIERPKDDDLRRTLRQAILDAKGPCRLRPLLDTPEQPPQE